ncbi:amidase signature domain-containing protein [Diplogelasinospora grovesii]|uniref:Amidase signature domain-containing protein n=1 Tax=Diplogelasinospora grovesii TaxID=303347 RepID=A0AAN6S679_9PEZI|nr:amidase signature domain-containing protein [Diplogelasinospora grovesii]
MAGRSFSSQGLAQTSFDGYAVDLLTIDARGLQTLLENGNVTSLDLVRQYLAQIQKHDDKFHAMIQTTPHEILEKTASLLDQERAAGKIRGPLHGIPILIKDNVATHPSLGLPTSAGSYALLNSKPQANARIIDQLIAAGLIILGKSNLSEFANCKGSDMPSGWSAVGGQVQSAYVRGGVDPNDSKDGHSSPSGSSSGSAVGVSAGYAPLAIGTETDGSLVCPAGRAALYTIKPTIGLVPGEGIVPVSTHFDSAGPMTKSAYDLATLLDILASKPPSDRGGSYVAHLTGSWSDISVAVLDPDKWKFPEAWVKPVDGAEVQISREIRQAYDVIRSKAKKFVNNIDLISIDEFNIDGENSENIITQTDMKRNLTAYLENLAESEVRSIADLVAFNEKHADIELPPHHPRQDVLIDAMTRNTSIETYERHLQHLRNVARDRGVDHVLKSYGVDVILGPTDSGLTSMATGGGFPLCAMPLSYLDFNGRPFSVSAIAGRGQDALLVKVMSAWEATFPHRKPPPQLLEEENSS